jgi:hypothetical protein
MKKILYAGLAATVLLSVLSGCMTPLTIATSKGNTQTVRQLMEENNFSQKDLNSALYEAAISDHHDIAKMLIDKGADVNSQPWTAADRPLFIASYSGHPKTAAVLLEHGANIYQKGRIIHSGGLFGSIKTFHVTPLAVAALKGHSNVVSIFLNKAAEPDIAVEAALVDLEILFSRFPEAKAGQVMLQRRLAKTSEPDLSTTAFHQKTPTVSPSTMPLAQIDMTDTSLDLGAYHALVIGNNEYQNLPKLSTATNDALAITHLLQNVYGFKVRLLTNATRSDILLAINAYRRELTPRDNLLIYYAGHGWLDKDADQGYWLPVNATRDNPINWISNNAITSEIRAIQAKHIIVVADSCYSGKLTRGLHVIQRTPNYLRRNSQKKARVVLSSGGLEPVLDQGGNGNHSVFASAFIETLSENKGVLDGTTLFSQIRKQVGWNADQTPEYSNIHKAGHDGGDFIFSRTDKQ